MGNMKIKQHLTAFFKKGIQFELSQEKLLVKGDLTVLTNEDKQFLTDNKTAIIELIKNKTKKVPTIQKLKPEDSKPLSFSQQSLWLLDKINDGSSHYNLNSAFRLNGDINYKALNRTFLTILQRHESLRSFFTVNENGDPIQKVQAVEDFNVTIEDLNVSAEDREMEIKRIIEEESQRGFDLNKDLLLHVRLLRMTETEHILIVTMHHIASDGWSMGVLVSEFNTLYRSYIKGEDNPLAPLNIQYSDYAHWQRKWLDGSVLEDHKKYWREQLMDLPTVHNLPLDKPRPAVQNFNGRIHYSFMDEKVLAGLRDLCQSESVSLFMGLHAAYSSFLARYSNEKDIVVGSPIANREQAEIAGLVGFFMNLLVLRSDFSENPSYRQLLRQSKATLEDAYEYQQMPYEKVVEALQVKRTLSHNSLFQILLTLHNTEAGEFKSSGLEMEPVIYESKSAKYDLSLDVTESKEGLYFAWEYNTDLFEASTIASMADHFQTLLVEMLASPDENVFKVNLISEKESEKIYKKMQGPQAELSKEDQTISIFEKQVRDKPNETAIIWNDEQYSYKELGAKVNVIANHLKSHGVKNGDRVGLCFPRNVELVASIFACFKIGAAYIPLDPIYPADRLSQIITDAEPKCILTFSALKKLYLDNIPKDEFIYLDRLNTEEIELIESDCSDENTAYVIFTSGTTGKPKGIEITHANLNNLLKGFDNSFPSKDQQRWLAQTSLNFDISVLELIWPISRGQTIVLQQTNPFKMLSPNQLNVPRKLDFSVMFFGADKNVEQKYDLLLETAKFADKNNFSAIWTPERHFGEFGGAFPNPSVISSALAVLTDQISIRSGSVVLPLHDPVRVAEEWSLVDNLSKGRIGLSIASGWQPDDFVFSGADYKNRYEEMREKVVELKALWKGESVTRKNGLGNDFAVSIRPKPIQKEVPMWITAGGNPDTFKYAGSIGANLLTHMLGQSLGKLKDNIAIYHQSLKDHGFKVEDKKVSLMLHTYIDETEQLALGISEQPFKDYLGSSIKLMEPLAKEVGIDVETQRDELIDLAFTRFSKQNTLIGSPESCQRMLFSIQEMGVTEVACLVDFGVENEKVLNGLTKIAETKDLYEANGSFIKLLNTDNQKTELDLIDEYQVTHIQMTPSQSKLILDLYHQSDAKNLSSVKQWFVGGEALNAEVIKGLSAITDCNFYNMYGPTETTVWSAWREVNSQDIGIGAPILNTNLLLLNEFEQQVPIGVVGELYIGGKGLAKGYYDNDTLTQERFKVIDHPYFGKSRFYKTGDLMKLNADGTFEYIGRKDNQVKINGYRIELEEIEKNISNVLGVKNCKVVPIIKDMSTSLSAYVVQEGVVHGEYTELPLAQQAKPFHFADGSTIYHQSDRQLAMLYKEIIEDGIYFKHGISIQENGLVLDLGSNIGTFSIDVNQRYPSATVIAFEPIPQIFSGLKKNFEHRQIKGRVMNYGVSNKKDTATFFYYPEMSGMSGMFADKETIVSAVGQYMEYDKKMLEEQGPANTSKSQNVVESFYNQVEGSTEFDEYLSSLYEAQEVKCKLTTVSDVIDDLGINCIDLLKLDVEKSECLVLEGIRPEHWPMIRHMAVEVDGDQNLEIILKLLGDKGYTVNVEELVMSDASTSNEENTYMLYATNLEHGTGDNDQLQLHSQVNEADIRSTLKQKLPDYMNPKNISFVPSIPLMENGKVDMVKLKSIEPKKATSKETVKLTNKTELAIYNIWCEVLKKQDIPHHVSIFEAGGNSMEVVLLHEKIQRTFEVNFSLVELFRSPTIPQQAKLVQNAQPKTKKTVKKALDKGKSRRQARRRTQRVK